MRVRPLRPLTKKISTLEERLKSLEEKSSAGQASGGLKVQDMQGQNVSDASSLAGQNPYGSTEKLDPKKLEELNKQMELIKKSQKEQAEFLKELDSTP